ncbi:sigma-70 family RNA polymerase sigma factor [Nonomuraea sp. NPDC023979]|uniref:sigma-70 family RNA polymerase sigma factor n=1 Tax=Nonomuraea sp. NPDC023979 TaxID=3154796 RepID=UPI0033C55A71
MTDTSRPDLLAAAFEAERDRLGAVAYRVLGSHADAEDVVQEAWIRLARQDTTAIANLPGWLTTVVGRISLDVLRSRRTRPEATYGDGLSELVITVDDGDEPGETVSVADSVGLALLVVLDVLGPSERLTFVLHDLFAVPFAEIGQILGKSADATKMIASRARRKVRAAERPMIARREQRRVIKAFREAVTDGDFEALLRVLDPDVRLTVDTPGGEVVTLGATAVASGARLFSGAVARHRAVLVNGLPGYVSWREDGTPLSIISFAVTDDRITAIAIVANPPRLASTPLPAPAPDPA